MRVFENIQPGALATRSHPWIAAKAEPRHRHWNFRADPARIRTALEDVRPLDTMPACETFYRLVAWLNGPSSPFESNDCALGEVEPNPSAALEGRLQCSGRRMVPFRDLAQNTDPARVHALTQATACAPGHPRATRRPTPP